MPERIQPALSPEEWERRRTEPSSDPEGRPMPFVRLEVEGRWEGLWTEDTEGYEIWFRQPTDRHALAALALHGQPFGFTWEDVRLLRRAAVRMSVVTVQRARIRINPALTNLADRIAALLPPEEEE